MICLQFNDCAFSGHRRMSISACQNDHGSYTVNGSSVMNSAATKTVVNDAFVDLEAAMHTESVSSQTDFEVRNAELTGTVWSYSVATKSNFSESFGSQHSTVSEFSQSQPDSLHLNVPVREYEEEESATNAADSKVSDVRAEVPPSTSFEAADRDDSDEDGEIDIQIRNVVCNYTLPLHIDLHRVALSSGNVAFDRGRGVLLKQKRNPSCYVKIYSSGKIYIVGCRSESECKRAARGVARMVQKSMGKLMDIVRIRNYRVCNVLATCKMPFGIKIEELAQKYPDCSQYEPELSVGLIWRFTTPRATLRIHTTGSITVTGAASESDVMKAIEVIYPIIKEFRCSLRLRNPIATKISRKRKERVVGNFGKRPRAMQPGVQDQRFSGASGAFGNRVYFSDEDDEEEDEFEDVV